MAEDDAPLEPVAPEAVTEPTDAAVTEPVPTATPSGPPPWGEPSAASTGTPAPSGARSSTVAVPKWLLLVVGALVIALLGFAVGYAVAPDDDIDAVRANSGFVLPDPSDNDGRSPNSPSIPSPGPSEQGGAFLGVNTSRSTDPAGARIVRVVAGTPAADAGLETDDVITKVDDDDVNNPTQLARQIQGHEDGDEVTITYLRDGSTETVDVTLATRNAFEIPTPSTTRPRS